jgi:hypothetical protein
MSKLLSSLKTAANTTLTENGAVAFATTKSGIVDFFAQAGSMRSRSERDIINLFNQAFAEDKLITLKLCYYFRDIRKGQGERRLFKILIKYLANNNPEIVIKNLKHIPFFGRWDDLFELFGTPCETAMLQMIKEQFNADISSDNPSLLGKWMKSNNASSKESKEIAQKLEQVLHLTPREYRKALVTLRKKIKIVETLITNKEYGGIDYSSVPSQANMKYMKAFWKNDEARYSEFVGQVKKGEKKVHAKVLYPYEITKSIINEYRGNYNRVNSKLDASLDIMWNALPDYVGENYSNTLAVIDGSASMYSGGSGYDYTPISSAIALGIYFAEKNKGAFKNHFITFSERPRLIEIKGSNISEKTVNVFRYNEVADTNIERVFDLILQTAKKDNLSQDEIPARIVIISDMEFNSATEYRVSDTEKLFTTIKRKWENSPYTMPRLTFWNLDARHESFPMTVDEVGVQFVSGQSPSIFTSILKDNFVTPLDLVLDVVNNERYDVIKV